MKIQPYVLILIFVCIVVFAGCTPGSGRYTENLPAGFFSGVWHGWIAPITLIIGFFDDTTRIYEQHNTGWWYDLGYYIAVISGFGGISLFRKRSKKK